jgi:hypothetical protein
MADCTVLDLFKNGGDISNTRFNLYAVTHLLQTLGDTDEPVSGNVEQRQL